MPEIIQLKVFFRHFTHLQDFRLTKDHCFWTADYSGHSAYCGLALAILLFFVSSISYRPTDLSLLKVVLGLHNIRSIWSYSIHL